MTAVKESFADTHPIKIFLLKVAGILVHGVLSGVFAHQLILRLFPEPNMEQLIVIPFMVAVCAMSAWIRPSTACFATILAAIVVVLCFAIAEPNRLQLAAATTLIFIPFTLPYGLEKLYRRFR